MTFKVVFFVVVVSSSVTSSVPSSVPPSVLFSAAFSDAAALLSAVVVPLSDELPDEPHDANVPVMSIQPMSTAKSFFMIILLYARETAHFFLVKYCFVPPDSATISSPFTL